MPAVDTYGTGKKGKPRYTLPKPVARKPRKPTPAELAASQRQQRASAPPTAKPKPVYGPPAPSPARKPKPAERTVAKARAIVRDKEGQRNYEDARAQYLRSQGGQRSAEDQRIEDYKQTPAYIATVQKARVARIATGPESGRRRNLWRDAAKPNPLSRVSAKEELRQRDFKAYGPKGYDQPRSDTEIANFLRTGKFVKRTGSAYQTALEQGRRRRASIVAPAAKVMDLAMRPTYAEASAAKAALHGKDPLKAAGRGIKGKDKTTFSGVARSVGVPRAVAGPLGLAADIGFDPLTYTSGGTKKISERVIEQAAKDAAKRAAEKNAGANLTKLMVKRAEADAARTAPAGRGLVIKVAGKELPGVTRGTGAAARTVGAGGRKVVPKAVRRAPTKVREGVRVVLRPMQRPTGVDEQAFTGARQSTRRARAHITTQEQRALLLAQELKRKLPADQYDRVIDAVERNRLGRIRDLGPDVRETAHNMRSALRGAHRLGRQAGAIAGKVGDTRRFLTKAHLDALTRSGDSEAAAQERRVAQLEKNAQRAAHKQDIAEREAQAVEVRKAAVATERARGSRRTESAVAGERSKRAAAVETEQARSAAGAAALKAQHAAEVEYEKALGGARASTARTKTSQTLRNLHTQRKATVAKGITEHVAEARKGVSEADKHVTRMARNVAALERQAQREQEKASRYEGITEGRHAGGAMTEAAGRRAADQHQRIGELADIVHSATKAHKRATEAAQAARDHLKAVEREAHSHHAGELADIDAAIAAERRRIAGVAPKQADRLHAAIEGRGRVKPKPTARVKPKPSPATVEALTRKGEDAAVARAPALLRPLREAERAQARAGRAVARVEPAVPKGKPLVKAREKRVERDVQHAHGQARAEAARNLPTRSAHETDREYLHRLRDYAAHHALPIVAARVQKLIDAEPKDIARGYYPRDFEDRVLKQLGVKPKEVEPGAALGKGPSGRKVMRITAGYKRADQRRLAGVNAGREAKGQEQFSTDIPLVVLNHLKRVARATSQADYAKDLTSQAKREYKPLQTPRAGESAADFAARRKAHAKAFTDALGDGEQVYKLGQTGGQYGLSPVSHVPARPRLNDPAQYVVLDRRLVETMEALGQRAAATTPIGKGFDRGTGAFKRLAIATLGFHVRNALGDVPMHYIAAERGSRIGSNLRQAGRAVARESERVQNLRPPPTDATIPIAGKPMRMDEFLKGARENGVLDAGYIGRELEDLAGTGTARAQKVQGLAGGGVRKAAHAADRWMTNRENWTRVATYKAGLDQGLDQRAAADLANKVHIDYGELTESERIVLRRAFPFYTWTARSTPLLVEMLFKRPGKFANLEKLRTELSQTLGGGDDADQQYSGLTAAVQRQLPVVIKVGKGKQALSWSPPTTLFNELPTGFTPKALGEWSTEMKRFLGGQLNPLIRAPIERATGKNLVTNADIEGQGKQRITAAPSWVEHLPAEVKRKLDVIPPAKKAGQAGGYTDPRTGKPSWGWRGKADWTYDQFQIGPVGQVAGMLGAGRQQQTLAQGAGGLVGIRSDPANKTLQDRAARQAAQPELDRLKERQDVYNAMGYTAGNAPPEYRKILDRIAELEGRKRKAKVPAGLSGGGLGGGGLSGGGLGGGGLG